MIGLGEYFKRQTTPIFKFENRGSAIEYQQNSVQGKDEMGAGEGESMPDLMRLFSPVAVLIFRVNPYKI